ncbi:MAG: response regulator [Acidobacteria bacterium]|nr:response regulator [Acidobacteriota bacterium]
MESIVPLRILHLEDEPNDVELIRATLENDGLMCELDVATGREEFLAALDRDRMELVLSDFALPGFDGLSALRMVRERTPELPFIIVSGTLGEEAAIEALRSGATDYVLKDRLSRLGPAVRRAIEEAAERRKRRQVEEALHHDRQFLRALLESLEVGIIACDASGTLTHFNRAAREFHGLQDQDLPPLQEVIRGSLFRADGKTIMKQEDLPLLRALRGERVRNAEVTIVLREAPPRAVLVGGRPVLDARGRMLGAVVAIHDITERKQLEGQLRQAQKMEAVGRLAGGIAHDFNNLLNVITGYGELLSDHFPAGDPMIARVDQIRKAAQRAASLTRQLLAFSRKQVIEPRVIDLNVLLADLDKMLRRVIGEDIELTTVQGEDLGRIKADPGQIEQIVMNLSINARDAMPQGGRLKVETANADLDAAFARQHPGARPGSYVMLAVSDTGVGMDAETRSHVFEPFFTTKETGKGTGLGLATVYGIVKQNLGYISLSSEPGRGATFRIFLPRVNESPEALQARESAVPPRGTETVLVVEDEDAVRHVIGEALRQFGYTVLETGDAEEGVRLCEAHAGPIHLLVTDMVMPKVSGRVLARRVMAHRAGVKVLYMSGYTDGAVVQSGVLEPGISFLQKPFTLAALARKVRQTLDAQEPEAAPHRERSAG